MTETRSTTDTAGILVVTACKLAVVAWLAMLLLGALGYSLAFIVLLLAVVGASMVVNTVLLMFYLIVKLVADE